VLKPKQGAAGLEPAERGWEATRCEAFAAAIPTSSILYFFLSLLPTSCLQAALASGLVDVVLIPEASRACLRAAQHMCMSQLLCCVVPCLR
jgi:hypothetical protein